MEWVWFGMLTTVGWILAIMSLRNDSKSIEVSGEIQIWSHGVMLMSLVFSEDVIFTPLYNVLAGLVPTNSCGGVLSSLVPLLLLLAGFAWVISPYVFLFWLDYRQESKKQQ